MDLHQTPLSVQGGTATCNVALCMYGVCVHRYGNGDNRGTATVVEASEWILYHVLRLGISNG